MYIMFRDFIPMISDFKFKENFSISIILFQYLHYDF